MDQLGANRARLGHIVVAAAATVLLVACDNNSAPNPEPTALPAVCTALPDDLARTAVNAADDATVERIRDAGETDCSYSVDGSSVALNVRLVQTVEDPETYISDYVADPCKDGEAIEDITAIYCPADEFRATGASVTVAAGDHVVDVWHSGGYRVDNAQENLTEVASYISANPEAFNP